MRRIALVLLVTLLLTACGGPSSNTVVAADTVTTTVAEKPTTTTSEATGSAPTTAAPVSFDIAAGTPPAVFDSFQSALTMTMEFGGVAIELTSSGVWVDGAFDCILGTDMGGFGFEQGLIATPNTLWFDDGNGYEESGLFNSGAQEVMASCPTSPMFWAEFSTTDTAGLKGEKTTIDGREVYRADLTQLLGLAGGLGMAGDLDGAVINEMAIWIDIETGAPLRVVADMELPEDFVADLDEGAEFTGGMKMQMEVAVTNINDSTLAVATP